MAFNVAARPHSCICIFLPFLDINFSYQVTRLLSIQYDKLVPSLTLQISLFHCSESWLWYNWRFFVSWVPHSILSRRRHTYHVPNVSQPAILLAIVTGRKLMFIVSINFWLLFLTYHIAGKFGGELNLAAWQSVLQLPN